MRFCLPIACMPEACNTGLEIGSLLGRGARLRPDYLFSSEATWSSLESENQTFP